MAMRNWWIEADIDGRKTPMSGGPRGKGGGFYLTIYQRENGESRKAMTIQGHVTVSGELQLSVDCDGGNHDNDGKAWFLGPSAIPARAVLITQR